MIAVSIPAFVLGNCNYLDSSNIQAQSQGAITFKVVPGIKEEAPSKEPKVGSCPVFIISWCSYTQWT